MNEKLRTYSTETLRTWSEATPLPRNEASRRLSDFVDAVPERIALLQNVTNVEVQAREPRACIDALEAWCVAELRSEYAQTPVRVRALREPRSEQDACAMRAFERDSESRTALLPNQAAKAVLLDVGIAMGQVLVERHCSQWALSKRKSSRMYARPYVALRDEWGLCPFVQPVTWFGRVYEDGATGVLWSIYEYYAMTGDGNV